MTPILLSSGPNHRKKKISVRLKSGWTHAADSRRSGWRLVHIFEFVETSIRQLHRAFLGWTPAKYAATWLGYQHKHQQGSACLVSCHFSFFDRTFDFPDFARAFLSFAMVPAVVFLVLWHPKLSTPWRQTIIINNLVLNYCGVTIAAVISPPEFYILLYARFNTTYCRDQYIALYDCAIRGFHNTDRGGNR